MKLKYRVTNLYYKYSRLFAPWYVREKMIMSSMGNLKGDYAEFGVYNGGSFIPACLFAKYNKLNMRFFAFDCFNGIPSNQLGKGNEAEWFKDGSHCCSQEEFEQNLKDRGIEGVIVTKGYFESVLTPKLREKIRMNKLRAVYMDCDLYLSTLSALRFITPCIQNGTIIMFDDWFHSNEKVAVDKWLAENPNISLDRFLNFHSGLSFVIRLPRKSLKDFRGIGKPSFPLKEKERKKE